MVAVPELKSRTARRSPTAAEFDFLRERRVGRLATADAAGRPSIVPICYAVVEHDGAPVVVSALDEKPKGVAVTDLARVRHIQAQPEVALVVDDYHDDWDRLAFVHLKGLAALVEPGAAGHAEAVGVLRAKYPQYERMAIERRPLIRINALSATSWRGSAAEAEGNGAFARPSDLDAIVRGRRSVRAYADRPVEREIIERAIAAAGWAPSPHGRQPWRFAVVVDPVRKAALAQAMADTWRQQLDLDGQNAAIVQTRLDKGRQRLLQAPVLILPCLYLADLDPYPDRDRQAAETTMAIQSLGAAIQNLLLTIYASGLDAGWMCAPLFCPDVARDALGLDPALVPHALLTIGYAAKDPIRRDRLPLDRLIVSWQ